jgi:coenzyme F420-reducing hydrogenase alpha subunit
VRRYEKGVLVGEIDAPKLGIVEWVQSELARARTLDEGPYVNARICTLCETLYHLRRLGF